VFGEFVFSHNGSGLGGWSKAKRAIDAAAADMNGGPLAAWRLHDVRRTAATNLQRLGVGLQVVESILGHVAGSRSGIVGVYQRHQFQAEQRAALTAWASEVNRIVQGKRTPTVHFASAVFAGSGSLSSPAEIKPIDPQWREAVAQAYKNRNLDSVVAYLQLPGVQLGTGECYWLRRLLEGMQFKRKRRGRPPLLVQQSRTQQHEIAAAHFRDLQQTEGLTHDAALNRVIGHYPEWYKNDAGESLRNYLRRGSR
jgi:hypothetical protein